jgi:hypothetical protein
MNSEATKHGPFEQSSPTRDWLRESKREYDLTAVTAVAYGLFILAAVAFGLYVTFQPMLGHLASYLGVK